MWYYIYIGFASTYVYLASFYYINGKASTKSETDGRKLQILCKTIRKIQPYDFDSIDRSNLGIKYLLVPEQFRIRKGVLSRLSYNRSSVLNDRIDDASDDFELLRI